MPNTITQRDVLEILVQYIGSDANNKDSVKSVGVPKLGVVITKGSDGKFVELKTQYHVFPAYPQLDIANDLVDLLRNELRGGNMFRQAFTTIKSGETVAQCGLHFVIPAPNRTIEVPIGIFAYEREVNGADATINKFRKSLEGSGALE